jgi:hypothetical protein
LACARRRRSPSVTQFFVLAQFAEGQSAEEWRRLALAVLVTVSFYSAGRG